MLLILLAMPCWLAGQTWVPVAAVGGDSPAANGAPVAITQPRTPEAEREVSWKRLPSNVLRDQKPIWLFPFHVNRNNWMPTTLVLGATAGLAAAEPHSASYFRFTRNFQWLNDAFPGKGTKIGMGAFVPSLYLAGLIRRDSRMQKTAMFAIEAVVDSEILTTVLKDIDRRTRPAGIDDYPRGTGDYHDTWFRSKGSLWHGNGSMPSGHAIAAFSIATVVARRHGNHRWVPFVAYGLAACVAFSRVTLNAHFPSDVLMGSALGYSISRFVVLRH